MAKQPDIDTTDTIDDFSWEGDFEPIEIPEPDTPPDETDLPINGAPYSTGPDHVVIRNSKGTIWTYSQIADPDGCFQGDACKAIRAAILDLSNGESPCLTELDIDAVCGAADSPINNTGFHAQSWQGTVWVYRDVHFKTGPVYLRRNLHLDFLSNLVTLDGDFTFLQVGQDIDMPLNTHVRNVRVQPFAHQTKPILFVYGSHFDTRTPLNIIDYGSFSNIHILPRPGTSESTEPPLHDGIRVENAGPTSCHILSLTFKNIWMEDVGTGIHFVGRETSDWSNAHLFQNVHIDGFVSMIWYERLPLDYAPNVLSEPDINQHTFRHVQGRAKSYTRFGMRDIYGGWHHFDHVSIANWDVVPLSPGGGVRPDWTLDGSGYYICANNLSTEIELPTRVDAPYSSRNVMEDP